MTPTDSAIARRLRVQCERFGWMGGMLTTDGERVMESNPEGWPRFAGDEMFTPPGERAYVDPHDPATVGCFAAMARRATGRRLYAVPTIDGDAWQVCEPASFGENEPAETAADGSFGHATEIEAWLAVLEATP